MRCLVLLVMGLMVLTGCSPIKLPTVSTYELSSFSSSDVPTHTSSKAIIAVSNPVANPGYETSQMAYIGTPYQLSYFTRSRWVAPPQQMLLPLVVEALRKQGHYKAVVPAPHLTKTDYRLDLSLLSLEQDFLLPESRERVIIQATLVDDENNQVISSRQFSTVISAKTNTPYGGVLAANEAVASLCRQIACWCVGNSHD